MGFGSAIPHDRLPSIIWISSTKVQWVVYMQREEEQGKLSLL